MRKIKLTEAQLKYCIAHSLKEHKNNGTVTFETDPRTAKQNASKIADTANRLKQQGVDVVVDQNSDPRNEKITPQDIANGPIAESFTKKDFEKMRKRK